jgi:WD40 repeat protein/serine/threonine protein kinase
MADDPKPADPRAPNADDALTLSLPARPAPPSPAPAGPPQPKRRSLTRSFEGESAAPKIPHGEDFATLTKAPVPASDATLTQGGIAPAVNSEAAAEMTLTRGAPRPATPSVAVAGKRMVARTTTRRLMTSGRETQLLEKPVWDVGDIIAGKYEVTAIAGKGGMGVVYKVHHREWNIDMAVKTPLPDLVEDAVSRERFIREAQTWVDLGLHPNLVQCWYVRELGRLPRLFVDFMEGGSLKDWADNGRINAGDWATIIDMVVQAADGLGYAHERGVVHRDVKPANMLLTNEGRLCVTDFGLVKVANLEDIVSAPETASSTALVSELTMTGSSMGTPQYGAPEQWGGARHVDGRSDLYALGITLYELCCGRRPFDDRAQREPAHVIIGRHLTTTPPDPRTFKSDIPQPLVDVALKSLAKKPDDRYPTMRALREALAAAYQEILGKPYSREAPRVGEARAAALNNRAVSMWDLGKPDEAIAAWHEAIKLDSQHAESIYNLGLVEWRGARTTDDALEQRLVAAQQSKNRATLYIGYVQLESCAAAESEKNLQKAIAEPDLAGDGAVWRTLGHTQMAQHKFEEAGQSYGKSLELNPGDDVAQACRALAEQRSRTPLPPGTSSAAAAILDDDGGIFPNLGPERVFQDRGGSVHSVAMLPDGKTGLSDGPLGSVMRWDFASGKLIKSHNVHSKVVKCVVTTPDGTHSVSGGEDGMLRMWNLVTDLPPDFFGRGHVGPINSVAMFSDGKHCATGGGDKSVRVWELHKGLITKTLWGHESDVNAVVVTEDMQTLISGASDGSLRIWDVATATWRRIIKDGQKIIFGVCMHPDMKRVFSAGSEGSLYLYNLETGTREHAYVGHNGTVRCVAATENGRFLLSGGDDHTVRLWDIESGRCLRTIRGHLGPVQTLALSSDGLHLLCGSAENEGRPLRLWKLEHGGGEAELYAATMAVCRVQNQLQAQNVSREFEAQLTAARAALEAGSARDACEHLKLAREVPGYERDPRALELHALLSRTLSRVGLSGAHLLAVTEHKHASGVRVVAVTADGKLALSAGREDRMLCLWNTSTGKLLHKLEGHKQPAEAVALTPKGELAVSGGQDYTLQVWDATTGKSVRTLEGHNGTVTALAMRSDGKNIVSASADGWLRYWDLASGRCMKILESDVPAQATAIARDNRLVVSGHNDGSLRLWSLISGKCMKTLTGHSGSIYDVDFTPDNRFIVSAGEDKTLRVWNVDSGHCTATIKDPKARFQALALSPDSRYAFTGGLEGPDTPVRMWDVFNGQCVATIAPHSKGITAYALSADGCLLISGGEDTLRVWDLEWELDPGRQMLLPTLSADSPRNTVAPGATGRLSQVPPAQKTVTPPASLPNPTAPPKKPGANPFGF